MVVQLENTLSCFGEEGEWYSDKLVEPNWPLEGKAQDSGSRQM